MLDLISYVFFCVLLYDCYISSLFMGTIYHTVILFIYLFIYCCRCNSTMQGRSYVLCIWFWVSLHLLCTHWEFSLVQNVSPTCDAFCINDWCQMQAKPSDSTCWWTTVIGPSRQYAPLKVIFLNILPLIHNWPHLCRLQSVF